MWINDKRIFDSFAVNEDDDGNRIETIAVVNVNGRDEGQFLAYDGDDNEYVIYNPTLDAFVKENDIGDEFQIVAKFDGDKLVWHIMKDDKHVTGSTHVTVGEENGVAVDKCLSPAQSE